MLSHAACTPLPPSMALDYGEGREGVRVWCNSVNLWHLGAEERGEAENVAQTSHRTDMGGGNIAITDDSSRDDSSRDFRLMCFVELTLVRAMLTR